MEALQWGELKVHGHLGSGAGGEVFLAETAGGEWLAVKWFAAERVDVVALRDQLRVMWRGGWPEGMLELRAADLDASPVLLATPFLGELPREGGRAKSRSWQQALTAGPAAQRDPAAVLAFARALASLHERGIAHGNLKPGNVFADEAGRVLLADPAHAPRVPGGPRELFNDAILYRAPERLTALPGDPAAAMASDVFSFGVLAYRWLAGRFPRCDEAFSKVAPKPGEPPRRNLRADPEKIARNLARQPAVEWPRPPADDAERRLRSWIEACLELDPALRPASMASALASREGSREPLAAAAAAPAAGESPAPRPDPDESAERRSRLGPVLVWLLILLVLAALAAAAVMVFQVGALDKQLESERWRRMTVEQMREQDLEAERGARLEVERQAEELRLAAEVDRELARNHLEVSRVIGDRLFAWAMETDHRQLPPLDGREPRLKALERYLQDMLEEGGEHAWLEEERARTRLQLAEISLAAGEAEEAARRLDAAREASDPAAVGPDWSLRMAGNRLLLALLLLDRASAEGPRALMAARAELEALDRERVEVDRLDQLLAVADLHEARLLSSSGRDEDALEVALRGAQALNRLASLRPDSAALRSELAAAYLTSAEVLDDLGSHGEAVEIRNLGTGELERLHEKFPDDPRVKLQLADGYGTLAEAALALGDRTAALARTADAIGLLEGLIAERPDHDAARLRLASLLGLRAGLLRDLGRGTEAREGFEEGIEILEELGGEGSDDPSLAYRLAMLWWQKARLLGSAGDRAAEVELISRAHVLLARLAGGGGPGPSPEQLARSKAYLLGDLGHAMQLSGDAASARRSFENAVKEWNVLLEIRPRSDEYLEGLAWCRERVAQLD